MFRIPAEIKSVHRIQCIYLTVFEKSANAWREDTWEILMAQLDERVEMLRCVEKLGIGEYRWLVRIAVQYLKAHRDESKVTELVRRVIEETRAPINQLGILTFDPKDERLIRKDLAECREELRAVLE